MERVEAGVLEGERAVGNVKTAKDRTERWLLAYVLVVGLAGAVAATLLIGGGGLRFRMPALLLGLVFAMVVAERFPMEVAWRNQNLQFSLSSTFGLLLFFVHGAAIAATVQAALWVVVFAVRRKGWMKVLFNGGQIVLSFGAMAAVAGWFGFEPGHQRSLSQLDAREIAVIVLTLVVFLMTNAGLTSLARALSSNATWREVVRMWFNAELSIELAVLLLVPALLVSLDNSPLLLVLTCIPMIGFYFAIKAALQNTVLLEEKQRGLEAQREAEQQLRQAQKMEAFGQLAGGVAHDFNNLLSVILNYANFAREDLEPSHTARGDLDEIVKAGERAARLTRQLLSFSRQEVLAPQVLQVNEVVFEIDRMLRRTLGEHIEMSTVAGDAPLVRIDRGQLEQIVLNLALNARDAMPRGGSLVIETDRVMLESKEGLVDHARLRVRDTGCGIAADELQRIFEPFFTTKDRGEGTGLGLATVYGAVQQCGGRVDVTSEVGRGTEFIILLPATAAVQEEMTDVRRHERDMAPLTILLVEDDDAVRAMVERVLKRFGAQVLTAASGSEALRLSAGYDDRIDLLVTDVVMPLMSGKELATEHVLLRPTTPVLFMSGYTDRFIAEHGVLGEDEHLLQKPFSAGDLRQAVEVVLGRRDRVRVVHGSLTGSAA